LRTAGERTDAADVSTAVPGEQHTGGAGHLFPALALDLGSGDVWSWHTTVTGSCRGLAPDAGIDIVVNDVRYRATRHGDAFSAEVRPRPGRNDVYATARTGPSPVRSAPVTLTGRRSPRPVARIEAAVSGDALELDGSASEPSGYDGAPIGASCWAMTPVDASVSTMRHASGRFWPLPVPDANGRYRVTLTVSDDQNRSDPASVIFEVAGGTPRLVDPFREKPAWTDGATAYGVIVRNFGTQGFRSVIDRLDDLVDLGVAALWLAPVNVSPAGDFGYAVVDYFDVRPEYGTLADFRRLVDEAHARGIRVLMDVVPNHTSSKHPYFVDAERNGDASPYRHFYERGEGQFPRHYFGWSHLPNLNFDNPDVRHFVTEALMYWVRELDVDGFRVDVAWGIRERRPDFWPAFCREFYRVKPDGLLVAEASARDPYYVNNGFGAAYDWTDDLGVWAWTEAFSNDNPDLAALKRALVNANGGFDPNSFVLRFLNNNDTGPRFITTHGVEMYRVALAMLMTLPGLPCIYTGDEVGAEFEPYATPGPIDWTDRHDLRSYHRQLIHLRRRHPALRTREWTVLEARPSDQVLAYVRQAPDGGSPVVVVLNFGPHELEAIVPMDGFLKTRCEATTWIDLLDGRSPALAGLDGLTVTMPPWGVRILSPAGPPEGSSGLGAAP